MAKESKNAVQVVVEGSEKPVSYEENVTSLSTLLSQALQSGDQQLLETALHITDAVVIEATLMKLSGSQAPALLTCLLERMTNKPNRVGQLLPWLRSCISVHATSLMKNQAASQPILQALQGFLEERLADREALLGLAGRLDLIMMQVVRRAAEGEEDAARSAALIHKPVAVFDDGSEDEEEEDELAPQIQYETDSSDESSDEEMDEDEDSDKEMSVDEDSE